MRLSGGTRSSGCCPPGRRVLDRLPDPADIVDAAARDTLQRIRRTLEQTAAAAAVEPSRVTLEGPVTLAAAVEAMSQQSGNRIELDAGVDPQVTVQLALRGVTFWRAIAALQEQTGLQMTLDEPLRSLRLFRPDISIPPQASRTTGIADSESAFLVRIELPQGDAADAARLVRLRVEVLAEPRLHPLFLSVRDANLVVAGRGGPLSPLNPLAARDVEFTAAGRTAFDLACLADRAWQLDELTIHGAFEVELIGRAEELRFTGLEGRLPIVRRRGDVTASLDALRGGESDSVAALLTLRYASGGPAFESHRVAALLRDARLELVSGERISAEPLTEFTREQNGALGATYRFAAPPVTWRQGTLVYTAPTVLVRTHVNFQTQIEPSGTP